MAIAAADGANARIAVQSTKSGASTLSATTDRTCAVDEWLIVTVAYDTAQLTGNTLSVSAGATGTWTRDAQLDAPDAGGSGAGVVIEVWRAKVTSSIASGSTVTVTFSGGTPAVQSMEVFAFTVGAGTDLKPKTGSSTITDVGTDAAASLAFTGANQPASGEMPFCASGWERTTVDVWTPDSDTTNGSWSTVATSGTSGGSATSNIKQHVQWKVVTATGDQTWGGTNDTAGDNASVGILYDEVTAVTAVGDTVGLVWNTRAAVGDSNVLRWNTRAIIGDQSDLRWGVRISIGDPLALQWAVRQAVGDQAALVWTTKAIAGKQLHALWDTRGIVNDDLVLRWGVRITAGDESVLRWNTRAAFGEALQLVWDVIGPIQKDLSVVWNVRANSAKSVELQWAVRILATKSANLQWAVRTFVGDPIALAWAVRQAAGDDNTLRWTTKAPVGRAAALVWDVEQNGAGVTIGRAYIVYL